MKLKFTFLLLVICILSYGQSNKMEELGKLYMSGNYEETIKRAKEYLIDDKENIDYIILLGRALTDYGEFKEAIHHLEYTVENDPHNSWRKAWALGYLGSCHYMLSDYEQSEKSLKACIDLNATKNATNYAYKRFLQFGYDKSFNDWKITESDNIRFHFQKMSESDMQLYVNSREEAFQQINEFFNCELPKKIDLFVWDSRDDAKKILRADLGFADPNYCVIHSYFKQTRGHEITHVISNYLAKNMVKTGLINEGTSVCFDLSNQDKESFVTEWIEKNDEKIKIKDIWMNWKKYPDELTYPLSGTFVKQLIDTFGKEKFLEFFVDQRYENAKEVFGSEIDVLIEDFEKKFN